MLAEVYRTRFLEAMQRYFLRVPDPWNNVRLMEIVHKGSAKAACNCRAAATDA